MTDKLIEQIKADRERDKESDAGWETGPVIWDEHTGDAAYVLVGRKIASPSIHDRIARVPDMEARILADAEALKAADEYLVKRLKALQTYFDLDEEELASLTKDERADTVRQHRLITEALAAYRKARENGND